MKQPRPPDYAAHGLPVFPAYEINVATGACSCGRKAGADCSPGKHPVGVLVPHGLSDASKDVTQVKAWLTARPKANWAMPTGAASGYIGLDVDPRHGGLQSMKDLTGTDVPGPAWGTDLIQRTPSGGYHLLFKHPDKLVKNKVGIRPGLDIRADGGYLMVAPSNHATDGVYDGVYEWLNGKAWLNGSGPSPAPPMPKYLINVLAEREFAPVIPDEVPEGQRDQTMTSMAGTMRQRGMGKEAILAALRIENQNRCRPPLGDSDLRRIANSAMSWTPDDLPLPPRTDIGNGQRMVIQHGADLRYSAEWHKWLLWMDTHWQADLDEEVVRRAKLTALSIGEEAKLVDANRTDAEAERTAIFKFAAGSQNISRIKAMIENARSDKPVSVQQTVFDTDPWKLNALSGTIDLKTGDLGKARRSDLITKVCPVLYDAHARCPTWDRFLDQTFAGDGAMIAFIQRAIGYSLTGDVREQKLFFLHGTGANGKSTLMETIGFLLSEYAQRAAFATFTQKASDGGPRNDIARMVGARMVIASEVDAGRRLDEALIKMLTGGDKISARFLFHEIFEFFPQFKVFVFGNHKPQILGTDHAIWRRIDLIPFEVKIPDAAQDKELKAKLRDERAGILAWAVRGCLDWQQGGLREPPQVLAATADYKQSQDVLEQFLRERTEVGDDAEIQANELLAAFTSWCQTNNERPWTMKAFAQRMAERPTNRPDWKRVAAAGTFYRRIRLRPAASSCGQPAF